MGDFYYLDYEYKNLEKHFNNNLKRVKKIFNYYIFIYRYNLLLIIILNFLIQVKNLCKL